MAKLPADIDQIAWYPMRIAYQQWGKVKNRLDKSGVHNFLPMECKLIERTTGQRRYENIPKISSMIFIQDSYHHIYEMKRSEEDLQPLRFYTRHFAYDPTQREIFAIPDKQMDDFMRMANSDDERVVYLEETDYLRSEGQRVRIAEGEFAGVEGVIKRIQGNKCVVIRIEGIAAIGWLRVDVGRRLILL